MPKAKLIIDILLIFKNSTGNILKPFCDCRYDLVGQDLSFCVCVCVCKTESKRTNHQWIKLLYPTLARANQVSFQKRRWREDKWILFKRDADVPTKVNSEMSQNFRNVPE